MSRANVVINFSYSNITSGRITATPKKSFIDKDGKLVISNIAYPSVAIASGSASITLPETELEGVAYRFLIESGTSTFVLVDSFDAIIKNVTPQNGNTLLTNFYSQDSLDTSLATIVDRLTIAPYIDRLATRIPGFSFKVWTTSEVFVKNDFTLRGDRLYQWISAISGSNNDPLLLGNYTDPGNLLDGSINTSANWRVSSASLKGAGTTTTDVDYNKASFAALATQPASRENLTQLDDQLRSSIAAPDLTNYARKDQANSFTQAQNLGAGGSVPNLSVDDNSSAIANTATVRAIISSIGISNLVNKVSILEERLNQGVNASLSTGVNTRQLNTILRNPSGDIVSLLSAVATIKTGTYLIIATAIANRAGGSKIFLFDNSNGTTLSTRSMSSYTGSNVATSASQNIEHSLFDVITFSVNTPVTLRHIVETGAADAGGFASNRSGYSELYSRLILFRLD